LKDLEVRVEQSKGQVEVGDLPSLEGDATQLRQLFQNLIGNALKFHKKDVPPIVKISSQLVTEYQNSLGELVPGKFCQISVTDRGIGFDEKYLDRIFAIFQRLHSRSEYEGTGIGLAICRKIVDRHNGMITAKSSLGEGTTFMVTLPLKQGDAPHLTLTVTSPDLIRHE
jgi:two-component system, NtrC family, sensor kinase